MASGKASHQPQFVKHPDRFSAAAAFSWPETRPASGKQKLLT
jgi:hypothetical protein